jgi:hypothetical protein
MGANVLARSDFYDWERQKEGIKNDNGKDCK